MRTNKDVDSLLLKKAMTLSGAEKKQVVEVTLKLLIAIKGQAPIKKFRGKLKWKGNLERMRED